MLHHTRPLLAPIFFLYTGINNYGDIDTLVEGYEKLLAIKELLESGSGNGYSAEELSGAGVYTDVVAKINTGGFVGDDPLKPNERYIKAENGELVLTSDQQDSFAAQIDRISAMAEMFTKAPVWMQKSIFPDISKVGSSTVNNVVNNNSRIVSSRYCGETSRSGNKKDKWECV